MVYASADSRQNPTIDEHFGPESHYADDVHTETGENAEECYATERELVCCLRSWRAGKKKNRKTIITGNEISSKFKFNREIYFKTKF